VPIAQVFKTIKTIKKMKKPTKTIATMAAIAVFGITSTTVFSQDETNIDQLMMKLDVNKDQVLDKDESKQNEDIFANFEEIDANEDSVINKEELENYYEID
jgi:DNA-directed RNA polymerase beta' subunit